MTCLIIHCSWQECKWLDTTMYCTAIWCENYKLLFFSLFGSSYTFCNGNEINGKTCLLDQFYLCTSCDFIFISDQATCNNSNNACQYVNCTCQSIFVRLVDVIGPIKIVCAENNVFKIQEQNNVMPYLFHWNPYTSIWKQGTEQVPNLHVKI
ncbi:hypothetical protein pb186bvf_020426 [Paramecium bursaria]